MATYGERFEELSDMAIRQIERWKAGERSHNQIISANADLKAFLITWVRNGEPDRNQKMPG